MSQLVNAQHQPVNGQASVKQATIDRFVRLEAEFLSALGEVFPECARLKSVILQFRVSCNLQSQREQRLQEWLTYMGPLAQAVRSKNADVVMRNANFPVDIDLEAKYYDEDVSDETRETTWMYLMELTNIATSYSIYSAVPDQMMTKISSMAETIANSMGDDQDGAAQGLDLQRIQRQVSDMITPEELEAFSQQIQQTDITHLQQQLMGAMGGIGGMNFPAS